MYVLIVAKIQEFDLLNDFMKILHL